MIKKRRRHYTGKPRDYALTPSPTPPVQFENIPKSPKKDLIFLRILAFLCNIALLGLVAFLIFQFIDNLFI